MCERAHAYTLNLQQLMEANMLWLIRCIRIWWMHTHLANPVCFVAVFSLNVRGCAVMTAFRPSHVVTNHAPPAFPGWHWLSVLKQ